MGVGVGGEGGVEEEGGEVVEGFDCVCRGGRGQEEEKEEEKKGRKGKGEEEEVERHVLWGLGLCFVFFCVEQN